MEKPSAVIFDLDGVLVDTAKYHYQAWKELASEMGFSFTEKENERLKGVSRMDSLNILLEIGGVQLTETDKLKLASQKNKHYVSLISKMDTSEILPGVSEFLIELKQKKIPVVLGSASKNAKRILKQINLLPLFDSIIDGTNVAKAKPDPEVFVLGAQAVDADPSSCVVFEDAQSGIEAAKKAGMYVIAVGEKGILKGADDYIISMSEMSLNRLLRR
ncbi:beta-phosphoglucomutase [Evansella tamaricis]|uniref:beta-phosphoglucomutase n=1 Tax=Evansella tamaricis TaxID=2069301 RepID=UPI0031B7F29E